MNTADRPTLEFDQAYADEQLRRSRHPLRRVIKGFYLRSVLRDVQGATIDFGCGAGQLLARLPNGSVGLEVNPHLVKGLCGDGFTVFQARGTKVDFDLPDIIAGRYQTLVIAHVLEHLPDPAQALTALLAACQRVGIRRVLVVVPGVKGFASDRTHKTFVDRAFIETRMPADIGGFVRSRITYFPGPWAWIGRFFVFHEMKVQFDRAGES